MQFGDVQNHVNSKKMAFTFVVESMVRGYHEYKTVWENPVLGEELRCVREIGNPHDPTAVAIQKEIGGEIVTVGHIPKRISALMSVFIRRGGIIKCTVNGARRYSADLVQGGLEIPCLLHFTAKNEKEANKTRELMRSSLISKGGQQSASESLMTPVIIKPVVKLENGVSLGDQSTIDEQVSNDCASNEDATEVSMDLTGVTGNSPPGKKQKQFDAEMIIMGHELSDLEINLAQQLLKAQFSKLNGLQSTLLQEKVVTQTKEELQNKLQLIFCKERKHWVVATTINCDRNEVAVYDSLFAFLDKESIRVVENLFTCDNVKPNIKMVKCQKQKGSKDCGVYAIAIATSLGFGLRPTKQAFRQDLMRLHLVNCFNKKSMSPFPCK